MFEKKVIFRHLLSFIKKFLLFTLSNIMEFSPDVLLIIRIFVRIRSCKGKKGISGIQFC